MDHKTYFCELLADKPTLDVDRTLEEFVNHKPQDSDLRILWVVHMAYLKCLYGQQGLCGFGISLTSKSVFKLKKLNSNAFLPWNQALNSLLWPRPMKSTAWWKIGAKWCHFRNISKCSVFSFLAWRPHCFTNFSLFAFCRRELLTTTETTVSWTSKIWQFLTWRHDPFKNPDFFCTNSRSTSLGVAEAGTLDLSALNCRNPIFFLTMPFYTLSWYQNCKNPVGRIDT